MRTPYLSRFTLHASRFTLLFVGTLAAARIAYELFFPRLLWLARPFPALTLAFILALSIELAWARFTLSPAHPLTLSPPSTSLRASFHPLTLSPLLLNLLYLFNPSVNLVQSRLIFAASLWLTAVLASGEWQVGKWKIGNVVLLLAGLIPVYFLTMPTTVGRADTFEFQVVAPQLGIAHPTGYPLYLLLGKLFTLIPVGSVAWRLNVGTAVFALTAAILLYLTGRKLLGQPLPALLGAIALGLTPTFWSQAIEAEVYSLHALIIAAALYLMVKINDLRLKIDDFRLKVEQSPIVNHQSSIINPYSLLFLIGLGLTNHLTTVFLLPPAVLTLFFAYRSPLKSSIVNRQSSIKLIIAFILPLSLYAYLPIRWAAVNGEAMGYGRFFDWVTGGRFQGALQWRAWLADPTRYEVVGRLFLENWGWINLVIAFVGLIYLFARQRRMALILLVTWLGYTFYNLNYYVPDLAVFLIPAHIVVAVWWMGGVTALLRLGDWRLETRDWRLPTISLQSPVSSLVLIPILLLAVQTWPQINRSQDDDLTRWGQGVLAMPLDENAAILADSEKIAPLYYLQQAEGVRPDLDIMVLPDEAAYRAELDARLAAGQTVYLARFLPGLEGIYHLRSAGPLIEVSTESMMDLPDTPALRADAASGVEVAVPTQLDFDGIQLIGYELEPEAAVDKTKTAITFYWQTSNPQPATTNQLVYVRWQGQDDFSSQHPANNYYPTLAWDSGEIVPDYHLLAHPISDREQKLAIQVALAPPFTPAEALVWQTVTTVMLPPTEKINWERPYRIQIGSTLLDSAQFPTQIRPEQPLPITLSGYGPAESLLFNLQSPIVRLGAHDEVSNLQSPVSNPQSPVPAPFTFAVEVEAGEENGRFDRLSAGRYQLTVSQPDTAAYCGWLQPASDSCLLGQVEISGVPLPESATNYDDKIALLQISLPQTGLQPGSQLPVTLTWQSLAPMRENYTVFIQILDANDRIVGQVDAWPLQGTRPTGQWTPGETITDPYLIWLDGDLPPGQYRLIVGWYLLADLRRLPILDESGTPIDDKLLVPGLVVP